MLKMDVKAVEIDISRGSSTDSLEGDGKYYASGSAKITLTRSYPLGLLGYESATHTPQGEKIGTIKHKGKPQTGFNDSLKSGSCSYITVYFSKLDRDYEKPLLITFDGKEYYYYASDDYWTKDDNSGQISLLKALDKQNCVRRNAHVVNICNSDPPSYRCPSCADMNIGVQSVDEKNDYKRVTHSISGTDKIDSIRNGSSTIIPSLGLESVTVYWYPLIDGSPLLICLGGGWIKRTSKTSNGWEQVKKNPLSNENDSPNILPLLQKIEEETDELSIGTKAGISIASICTGGAAIGVGVWRGPSLLSALKAAL
ncbi:hypothetical protein BEWA_030200 [Theileria equi strain WA]|uniref:Uncharacterized protein n=1 Tax=Theileria equi strain WA TaxID=1537102 RepID=L0AX53_THEEQ|nr:hypothetical protein BEWA_030200 [Theileria equi strain WA]AFZ80167.1 hypothetical protein BEWA_030200 [Theileria equi strain WA]|eukprot:XP_004829833.1 hypothetical protein BEWA_030200 [Theileria equi strain WA]